MQADYRLSVIADEARFQALESEWCELLSRVPGATVFCRWLWHCNWWSVYRSAGDRLHIVTVRDDDGRLVGLLPAYLKRQRFTGLFTLMFLGTGESRRDEVVTEYLDFLVDPEHRAASLALLAEHLRGNGSWYRIEFRCLLDDANLVLLARNAAVEGLELHAAGARFEVDLAGSESDYLARLAPSRAARIRRSLRALERDGSPVLDSLLAAEATGSADLAEATIAAGVAGTADERFDVAFRDLMELGHERQMAKGRRSIFASERFREFHRRVGRSFLAAGQADILRFRLGPRLLAVIYVFEDNNVCHYYQSGFSSQGANRYLSLTTAHLALMQHCRARGIHRYDFMRGDIDSYKADLGCICSPMWKLEAVQRPLPGFLYRSTQAVRQRLGRLRRSVSVWLN